MKIDGTRAHDRAADRMLGCRAAFDRSRDWG